MEKVVGREKEMAIFDQAMESDKSEFIAVTGRRRVGKTYLIKKYFEKSFCFSVTGIQNQGKDAQMQAFINELSIRQNKFMSKPKSWIEAFFLLREYLESVKTTKKKVIFIDELPWMDTQRSSFLQIMAHFWNSWAAWEGNIILVICGSATSWIIKKVFNDRGGLHNRVTKRISLKPFTLSETELFLKAKGINLERYQIAQIYMALGGIPFYLNEIIKGESAHQNIDRLCFAEQAPFKKEFDNLYKSLFDKPDNYITIIKALAANNYGLTREALLQKTKLSNAGSTTRLLFDLQESGFIDYISPFGNSNNNGKYVLVDFYSRFYLRFITGNKTKSWLTQHDSSIWKAWAGITFELIYYLHISKIEKALGIEGIYTKHHYLLLKNDTKELNSQIDIVIERADKSINLCEVKFADGEYDLTKAEAENIRQKTWNLQNQLKKRQMIFPTMLTTFGCTRNQHYLGIITNEVKLDDLF
jgi:uncharacterized protein